VPTFIFAAQIRGFFSGVLLYIYVSMVYVLRNLFVAGLLFGFIGFILEQAFLGYNKYWYHSSRQVLKE